LSNIAKRGAQNQPTKTPTVEGDKYTVLLLDEEQLDRFLNRPRLKSLSSHLSRTVDVWPRGQRLRIWATAAAVVVLAVTVVWLRADDEPSDTRPAARQIVDGPPLTTGASFSVNVTSFSRDADARIMAGRLTKAGLPSFAWRLNGSLRDVLVGPFVSIDEAEAAQQRVARLGYPRGRLHVDERLRSTDAVAPVADAKAVPAVLLVAAPGRLAVAFELGEEPQEVSGRRLDATTFAVSTSAGPSIDAQEWNAPSDVQLVKHVSVAADPRGLRGLEALVTVAENAVATVRLHGTRVYVDVSRAQLDFDERPAPAPIEPAAIEPPPMRAAGAAAQPPARAVAVPRPAAAPQAAPAPAATAVVGPRNGAAVPDGGQYRQAIGPVFARFEEIQPFLRSAVSTPTPEVLAAIAGTFAELEQTLRASDVPRASQGAHGLLLSAVQLARGAVAPTYSGDRMTQVREAMAQFQAAKAQLR
jgi:hypothetical protein